MDTLQGVLFYLFFVVIWLIISLSAVVIGFLCIYPFACALMVAVFKISNPAIREYCKQHEPSILLGVNRAWLRRMRWSSRLRLGAILGLFSTLFILWVALWVSLSIASIYLVTTDQDIDLEMVFLWLIVTIPPLVSLFYLIKMPLQLLNMNRLHKKRRLQVDSA